MKTWKKESIVVGVILALTVLLTGNSPIEWIGALAVFFTFGHASVSFRMSEEADKIENKTGTKIVECYKWTTRYFLLKELCWLTYFSLLGAYSALVGVIIFLIYPAWRTYHRSGND